MLLMSLNLQAATPRHITKSFTEWLAQALKLQREIDINAPLKEATFLATHNSYNSKAYAIPLVRYVDPNQTLSIYDQLDAGVRSIELDTHWTLNYYFSHEILLCHGEPNHLGCGMLGLPVKSGLDEIKSWLQTHPAEVVLLYLERHLDGHEPQMAAALEASLGDLIYKPSRLRQDPTNTSCLTLPTQLSKADILKAGKQVLVVVDECDDNNPTPYIDQDTYPYTWNDYAFAGTGDPAPANYRLLETTMNLFVDYPDCNQSTTFINDAKHTNLWRVYEDRTRLSNIFHHQRNILPEDILNLLSCPINWIGMDMLEKDDPRFAASIWSWAPNYPQAGQGACVIYKEGLGMINQDCSLIVASYACQNYLTRDFNTIHLAGSATEGEAFCQELGTQWHFAVPVNKHQMDSLKESMHSQGLTEVWLNYQENKQEQWVANNLGYA